MGWETIASQNAVIGCEWRTEAGTCRSEEYREAITWLWGCMFGVSTLLLGVSSPLVYSRCKTVAYAVQRLDANKRNLRALMGCAQTADWLAIRLYLNILFRMVHAALLCFHAGNTKTRNASTLRTTQQGAGTLMHLAQLNLSQICAEASLPC